VRSMLILTTAYLHNPSSYAYFRDFIEIMSNLTNKIYLVSPASEHSIRFRYLYKKRLTIISIRTNYHRSRLFGLLDHLMMQLTMAIIVFKLRKRISIVISIIDGTTLILPILVARLVGTNTLSVVTGPTYPVVKEQRGKMLSIFCYVAEMSTLFLSRLIIVESPNVLGYYANLGRIKGKTAAILPPIDTELFHADKRLPERRYHVGYVGRLSVEKGIIQFVYALRIIKQKYLNRFRNFKALIIGSGSLENRIRSLMEDGELEGLVDLLGTVKHELLSEYLNDIKLLVLPSYHEGVPRIVLESMACGTPILASRVGGIPDILKDGETGFLVTNEPGEIAERICYLLNEPKLLVKVSKNALLWIKKISEDVLAKKWEMAMDRLYK